MLDNLKVGNTVVFRCGGQSVVTKIGTIQDSALELFFDPEGREFWNYHTDGNIYVLMDMGVCPFDIIEVKP